MTMREPTAEMLADPALGACQANRDGCITLGAWRPFYQGYICDYCLAADQADVSAHRMPDWWPNSKKSRQSAGG